ncbi:hypothetical protein BTVI_64078 [Pitangus sulphuratus]|nr:hypothetical protein BTVI_64078 [Pitangus sulphuratus]
MIKCRLLECIDDNFLLQVAEEPVRRGAVLDLVLTKEGLVGNVKLKLSAHDVVEFRIPGTEEGTQTQQAPYPGLQESKFWPPQGPAWQEYHGIKPWREERRRNLVNIQGSSPPSSGEMHPNKEETGQKCQVCVDEQGAPESKQTQKGSLQRVEARTGAWEEHREIVQAARDF